MKALKVIGYVFLGIIALVLVMAGFGTVGLKQALALEIQSVDLNTIPDGEYTGEYNNARWSNTVEVIVKDHEITDINIIKSGNQSQFAVLDEIADKVIVSQKVNIDAVSGATATTNSLLKAIEKALAE